MENDYLNPHDAAASINKLVVSAALLVLLVVRAALALQSAVGNRS